MTKFKAPDYGKSIKYANKGLIVAIKSQRNFRFQVLVAALVLISALLLKFNRTEFCIIIFAIGFVLVAELFNSAIEFTLDATFHNKKNTIVGFAKDMSAGAVLISAITAAVIGSILFANKIFDIVVPGYFWF